MKNRGKSPISALHIVSALLLSSPALSASALESAVAPAQVLLEMSGWVINNDRGLDKSPDPDYVGSRQDNHNRKRGRSGLTKWPLERYEGSRPDTLVLDMGGQIPFGLR